MGEEEATLKLDKREHIYGRASRRRELCGPSPGCGSWCQAWNSEKPSVGWSERFGLESALSTPIITYATLLGKLWRPPFMDLEISLYISASACRAQIFPRGERQVVPPFSSPQLFPFRVRECVLGTPCFHGLASSICVQSFTNMPNRRRNRWVLNF